MIDEQQLKVALRDVPGDGALADLLIERAMDRGRRRKRRDRALTLMVSAAALAGVVTAAVLATGGGHTSHGVDRISTQPSPSERRHTPTPHPATSPSAGPLGLSDKQAAAIVKQCVSGSGYGGILADEQAKVQAVAHDKYGSSVWIAGPFRPGVKAPVTFTNTVPPPPTHTLLVLCDLLPSGKVYGSSDYQMRYRDNALPSQVLAEVVNGELINAEAASPDARGPYLFQIAGRVSRKVARMVWQSPTGRQVPVSIHDGYFVARAVDPSGPTQRSDHLLAFDAAGHPIDTTQSGSLFDPATKPVTTWP